MLSRAQTFYLDSVLGISAEDIRLLSNVAPAIPQTSPLILQIQTPALNDAEKALFKKILDSVQLQNFQHIEVLTDDLAAPHTLEFSGRRPVGRIQSPTGEVHWQMPALGDMTGVGAEVTARKKATWNWMQILARELGA